MEGEGGEEARDQAYQAEDREDWDQAYQASRLRQATGMARGAATAAWRAPGWPWGAGGMPNTTREYY